MFTILTGCSISAIRTEIQPQQNPATFNASVNASNTVVLDWNEQALNAVREGKLETAVAGRIYAGIHFEFSNQGGQKAGRNLAKEILMKKLK